LKSEIDSIRDSDDRTSIDYAFTVTTDPDIPIAEKLVIVAAVSLGVIQRCVGFFNQRLKVGCIFRINGNTDAGV